MCEYKFKGFITSIKDYDIPFEVNSGVVVFNLEAKQILPSDEQDVLLAGETNEGKSIYLLIDRFYVYSFIDSYNSGEETLMQSHLEGIVKGCVVLDSGTINDVDSLGFSSHLIEKITMRHFSVLLNDSNSSDFGIKNPLGKFILKNHKYDLSIGFVENEPYYSGQLLELKIDEKFDINSMIDAYWLIKRLFIFLFQKRNVPIDDIYLRNNEKNIGHLYIENLENSKTFIPKIKCIRISSLEPKMDSLLQLLADEKIYLRHVPMFKEEEKSLTPGRFLMALVGLENTLDYLNVHVAHSDKHLIALNDAKRKLSELAKNSSGREKKIYKRLVDRLEKDETYEDRIRVSLDENKEYITNFFPLSILGDNKDIAKDLGDIRNDLAHGELNAELGLNTNYQMQFLMVYILYLQLEMIGFTKKDASQIVPQILFRD